jgi:hypothetical protein
MPSTFSKLTLATFLIFTLTASLGALPARAQSSDNGATESRVEVPAKVTTKTNTKTTPKTKATVKKTWHKTSDAVSGKKTETTTTTTTTETTDTSSKPSPGLEPAPSPTPMEENKNVFQKTGDVVDNAAKSAGNMIGGARDRRGGASFIGMVNYSPFDLIIPNKYGATVGWVRNGDNTYELEYLRGGLSVPFVVSDVGSMTDQRISLIAHSYFGSNSFNVSYGVSYFDFMIHIGEALLNRASAGNVPSLDVVSLQQLGLNFAIGNRWSFSKNITFGVDWFSWAQPLVTLKRESAFTQFSSNANDRNDVDQALKLASFFPRFALLKVQLGIMF